MKVYCAGAMRGDTKYQYFFKEIIKIVEETGNIVLSELSSSYEIKNLSDKEIYERDINWLKEADCMIAEVSGASTGVGYEISFGLHCLNIPVLALVHSEVKRLSAMISGNSSDKFYLRYYSDIEDLKREITKFLDFCVDSSKIK